MAICIIRSLKSDSVWYYYLGLLNICIYDWNFLLILPSGESQTLLAAAVERERAATEELLANKIQMSSMESQNSLLRQENSRFQAQLESEKNRLRKLEDENNRWACFLSVILDSVLTF